VTERVRADFNGLFGDILCLSHQDTAAGESGADVPFEVGMQVTAFDEDVDDNGAPDDLIASGVVERAPDWLQSEGSRWVLRIDADGLRHASEVEPKDN
jgi:hypothetical protein